MMNKEVDKVAQNESVETLQKQIIDQKQVIEKLTQSNQNWEAEEKAWFKKDYLVQNGIKEKFDRYFELKKQQRNFKMNDDEINWSSFFKTEQKNEATMVYPKTPKFEISSSQKEENTQWKNDLKFKIDPRLQKKIDNSQKKRVE